MLLCLSASAWGDWATPSCASPTSISSAPYTISTSNTCYQVTANLTHTGTAITIGSGVNNVKLELNGKTITFGNGNTTADVHGIYVNSGCDSISIYGDGHIIDGGDSAASDRNCIQFSSGSFCVYIDGVHMSTGRNTKDAHCIEAYGQYSWWITNCTLSQNSLWYTARMNYDGSAMTMFGFENSQPPSTAPYDMKFTHNLIDSCHHTGVRFKGICRADSNDIYISAVNLLYPSGGGGGSGQNSSNAYGFTYRQCSTIVVGDTTYQSTIIGNNFYSYGEYFGFDGGIELEATHGADSGNRVEINNNTIVGGRGYDPDYPSLAGRGVKWRSESRDCGWVRFKNEDYTIYSYKATGWSDTLTDSSQWGDAAFGFVLLFDPTWFHDNVIESCDVRVWSLLDTTHAEYNHPAEPTHGFVAAQGIGDNGSCATIRHCNYWTNTNAVCFMFETGGQYFDSLYGIDCNMVDTFAGRDPLFYANKSLTGVVCTGHVVLDWTMTPDNGWEDGFNIEESFELTWKRTLNIYVDGSDKAPVSGCTVYVWNAFGDSTVRGEAIASAVSDGTGWAYPIIPISYYNESATDTSNAQYNPHRIKAIFPTPIDSLSDTISFDISNWTDTLDLGSTPGGVAVAASGKVHMSGKVEVK
jgi:hypothetical protein